MSESSSGGRPPAIHPSGQFTHEEIDDYWCVTRLLLRPRIGAFAAEFVAINPLEGKCSLFCQRSVNALVGPVMGEVVEDRLLPKAGRQPRSSPPSQETPNLNQLTHHSHE